MALCCSHLIVDRAVINTSLTGLYIGQIENSLEGIGKGLTTKYPLNPWLRDSISLAGEAE